MTSDVWTVKSVDIPQQNVTTLKPEEPEETTLPQICSPYVDPAMSTLTLSELELSLEDLSEESTSEEKESSCLAFSSTLKQISKIEEGGYELHFEVPENERDTVAELIKRGGGVFYLTII